MRRRRRAELALVVLAGARIVGCGGHVETSNDRPALPRGAGGAPQSAPLFAVTDASAPGAFPACSGEFCSPPGGGAPGSGGSSNAGAGSAGGSTPAGGATTAGGAPGTGGIDVDAGQHGAPLAITYRTGKATVDVFTVLSESDGGSEGVMDLTTDADGNVWFLSTDHVGRLTPAGAVTLFPVREEPVAGYPRSIVTGSDDDFWFTRNDGGNVTRVTTEGVMTEFPLPAVAWFDAPALVAGTDTLWFGGQQFGFIGEMSLAGAVSEVPVPTSDGIGLAVGTDGTLWFDSTYFPDGGFTPFYRITRRTTGGASEDYPVPSVVGPMIVDRTETLWFSETDPGKLAHLAPDGSLREVDVQRGADPNSIQFGINDITADASGNPWFVEPETSAIATIDVASGVMTEFSVVDPVCGTCVLPTQLAVASSGAVWFVRGVEVGIDGTRTTIGRLTAGG